MGKLAVVAAIVFSLAIAGCVQDTQEDPIGSHFSPFWSESALESHEGHDHSDALQHLNRSTPNFRVLGHHALHSDLYGAPPGSTFCGDAKQMPDGRRIAAAESRSKVGFTLVDVTDPAQPEWIGELVMEHTRVYDLAVVPDGRHVVLVTQAVQGLPPLPPLSPMQALPLEQLPLPPPPVLTLRSACGEARVQVPAFGILANAPTDPFPRPSSILLVDISDPANPAIIDHQPLVGYGHSAFSTTIGTRTWVLATTTGPATALSAYETTSAFQFYEVQSTPAGARLNLLSIYKPQQDLRNPAPPIEIGPRGHDSWIAVHPGTGQTLAYLAAWERMEVLDLADPMQPRLVGDWTDKVEGRDSGGEIHSVLPLERLWQGRHYTIVGPEWKSRPADQPSGTIWVLDTTDPATPSAVAGWTLPHDVEWSGDFMFSNHYYAVQGHTLFVSMYHAGIWAVDLTPVLGPAATLGSTSALAATRDDGAPADSTMPAFTNLASIGVFMPVDPDVTVAVQTRWAPTLEEVLAFDDGTLLTFDGHTGAWTFTFDANDPAPAPEPWPIAPI